MVHAEEPTSTSPGWQANQVLARKGRHTPKNRPALPRMASQPGTRLEGTVHVIIFDTCLNGRNGVKTVVRTYVGVRQMRREAIHIQSESRTQCGSVMCLAAFHLVIRVDMSMPL